MGEEYVRRIMVFGSVPSLGPVIMFDDIEDLFKWAGSGTGADWTVERSATVAYNKTYSLHMKTRVTGPTSADSVSASRVFYTRPGKRYRIEALFRLEVLANAESLEFISIIYDGVDVHYPQVRYNPQLFRWEYWSAAGTWIAIPGGSQSIQQGAWHRVAFEFNELTKKYIKLECDGYEFNMSAIVYRTTGSSSPIQWIFGFDLLAQAATPPEAYFDDVLVMEI